MRALDVILKKRDGEPLLDNEIQFLIQGFTRGEVPDYQMSALAMAIFFKGMSGPELAALTNAMLHSGRTIDLSDLEGIPVDKHSTGGVGDKISIPLAPAVAACGVPVPMIAGRGLGHSGGTLDKLESIPGFSVRLSIEQFRRQVKELGSCIIGQTEEVAPADKKLYALRDVTGTVECIPLIASSIMSKKLAEGIKGLVLDVKYGSGAFMQDPQAAQLLAQTMVDIGTRMGTHTIARLTNMDQPNGVMTGNALEIKESIDVLKGHGPADVVALVVELGAEMLVMGEAASDMDLARKQIQNVLQNGLALDKFTRMIIAQGGDARVVDSYDMLASAKFQKPLLARTSGYVNAMDTRALGMATVLLGGGRQKTTDPIDASVGVEMKVRLGDRVEKGQPLCILHTSGKGDDQAFARLETAFSISELKVNPPALFGPRISSLSF